MKPQVILCTIPRSSNGGHAVYSFTKDRWDAVTHGDVFLLVARVRVSLFK